MIKKGYARESDSTPENGKSWYTGMYSIMVSTTCQICLFTLAKNAETIL